MERQALEFVVDASLKLLVEDHVRRAAGDALTRLTVAPVDGTPRYKITALVTRTAAPAIMRAVMNALDKKG